MYRSLSLFLEIHLETNGNKFFREVNFAELFQRPEKVHHDKKIKVKPIRRFNSSTRRMGARRGRR